MSRKVREGRKVNKFFVRTRSSGVFQSVPKCSGTRPSTPFDSLRLRSGTVAQGPVIIPEREARNIFGTFLNAKHKTLEALALLPLVS